MLQEIAHLETIKATLSEHEIVRVDHQRPLSSAYDRFRHPSKRSCPTLGADIESV